MEQQIQTKPIKEQMTQQSTVRQMQPIEEKKSGWLIWLIIALLIIGASVGVYFWKF